MAKLGLTSPALDDNSVSVEFMLADLDRSGLAPEDLGAYPIAPIALGQVGGYVIPYHDPQMWRIRYDRDEDKYTQPRGIRGVWWHPDKTLEQAREQPVIYLIEGEKKAAAFIKKWPHLFAFGIGGAHNALESLEDKTKAFLPDIIKVLTPGKQVYVILDGDILTKYGIQEAASNILFACTQHLVTAKIWYPPEGKGVDDWLVSSPTARLADLVEITPDKLEISRKTLYKQLKLTTNEDGNPWLNETNLGAIIGNYLTGRVINDRRMGLLLDGGPLEASQLENQCLQFIQNSHFHNAKPHQVAKGLELALDGIKHDRVLALVSKLEWDEVPRLDTWGSGCFETSNPKIANEWGRLLLTGMAMRILEPGSKVDIVPILVGAQGIGKTTFFEDLAMFENTSFYNSLTSFSHDANDGSRTEVIKLRQSVILDLGEGIIFDARKTSVELLKQRITQTADTFRQAYARTLSTIQRGFIFVGTSNRKDLLSDQTGSRRFFILQASRINKLSYDTKLQILAEARARYDELIKSNWWEIKLAREDLEVTQENKHISNVQELLNSEFRREDVFSEVLQDLIDNNRIATYKDGRGYFISLPQLSAQLSDMNLNLDGLSNRVSRLKASITFKYAILDGKARPRAQQLTFPNGTEGLYMSTVKNEQQMLTGWALLHKP